MSKEAVVIIDLQNAILDIPGMRRRVETHAALDALLARIAALIRWARDRSIPVLFVQHDGQAGHRLERGSPGWEIRPEITPTRGDPVIHKSACDSFFETTLATELTSRGIGALIVAGCMTQYCIDTTVRRAVSLGYDVTLVADGHMTADSGGPTFEQIIAHHNIVLDGFDAGKHSVRVLPLDQILL
ncbi:MAG: cysteine hydrolase family protein [Candidatus Korobacteraceae bacterium]